MNARSQVFELSVESNQVEEVVTSLFHTLLFHRSWGKFNYKQEGSYSIGTLGFEDVDCDFLDLTFVRSASEELDKSLKEEVNAFCQALKCDENSQTGQISLEFFQKKKTRWPFSAESIPWEVWTVKIQIQDLSNEHERQVWRERLGIALSEKLMYITEAMNKQDYVPKMPNQSELDLIFNTNFSDVQPYLYKISYQTCGPANGSMRTAVRKLIKDTLAL